MCDKHSFWLFGDDDEGQEDNKNKSISSGSFGFDGFHHDNNFRSKSIHLLTKTKSRMLPNVSLNEEE